MSDTKIAPEYSQDRALGNLELAVVVPTFNDIESIVRWIHAGTPRWTSMRSKS